MKSASTLRILAGLSLLIFFCPFFQMCSFDASVLTDGLTGRPHKQKTKQELQAEEKQNTYNGYRLAGIATHTPDNISSVTVHFLVIFLVSVAVVYFAIAKSYSNVFWFSAISLVLLMPALVVLIFAFPFITIRYGFCLLLANNIVLMVLSRKTYKLCKDIYPE